jgi:hypothetical protein
MILAHQLKHIYFCLHWLTKSYIQNLQIMIKPAAIILFCFFALSLKAQTGAPAPKIQLYGKIDTADLLLKQCDFEKDANAEVLFDHAVVTYKYSTVIMERHKRIKIFNDHGNDEASIRIEFAGVHRDEDIIELQAETINLNNHTVEYTSVDSKTIYTQNVDKENKVIAFTFPNVKPGSVVEFKYKKTTPYGSNYPDWFFQGTIPTRYSEFDASFIHDFRFTLFRKIYQPLVRDTALESANRGGTRYVWALANVRSYKEEPYTDYPEDYIQCLLSKTDHSDRTWLKVGDWMLEDEDFGLQLTKTLANEGEIISKANKLNTDREKIIYLFDTVRNAMKWNKVDSWYCIDGVKKAWDKKTGNSAEINMILYHFLALANVNTYLLALKTRNTGKIDLAYPTFNQFDKTVVYCQADTGRYYVLDASDKLNAYDSTPLDLIGLQTLSIEAVSKKYRILTVPPGNTRVVSLVNGSIGTDGKLEGSAQISNATYGRKKTLELYNKIGEKEYINQMEKENNGLKISSLKLRNITKDTLPLIETFEFKYGLTEPDGDYIYFNPNVFTGFGNNPFLSETRVSNIDFRYLASYSINGRYKIPPGYKIDAMPKSVNMQLPAGGINFKRVVAEQDGDLLVHYTVDYKRVLYTKDEYPEISSFYKKMYEMLNEQIALKKQ